MMLNLAHHDQAQRQQALNANESFIVQAPAGSGKTTLLIQRFLTLLSHVKTPEEILAVTFTKKAANEMRVRILDALKESLHSPEPESASAKQTWLLAKEALKRDEQYHWNIISNPNQLRIQTIDSLCAYLTKQLPLLSHFGSQPDIADTPTLLYQEAIQEVLSHVEENLSWSPAIAKVLLHLDNDLNKLHDLLVELLAKRDQWLPYIHLDLSEEDIKKQLEFHLATVITDNLEFIQTLFPKQLLPELAILANYAADNVAANNGNATILACRDLHALPGTQLKDYPVWMGIVTLLLTEEHTWRKQFNINIGFPAASQTKNPQEKLRYNDYKQRALAVITELSENDDLRLALAKLTYLPESNYKENQWEILQALLQILKISAAQLRLTFQQHGKIDFIENTQAAIVALGNDEAPTDLALALDYQIRHILVDEFQDTSLTQYQLLEKLTLGWEAHDGRTLFIVGDPMQSIYRFREAEVGLFLRMRTDGIGQIKLTPLTLAMNFRSTANIVSWNNHHFQGIFPHSNDIATGSVIYNPSVARDQLLDEDKNSKISITGFIDDKGEVQGTKIVSIIKEHKKNKPEEKIAILVRARHHLHHVIPALKQADIPYRAVEIDPLAERQSIQDLLSLTSALSHPGDRIAWLAILRAPWCGLTLADLLIVVDNNPYATIYEQLHREDIINRLSISAQKRLGIIYPLLKSAMLNRERYDIRSWIENTWITLGGPACLQNMSDMDDVNAFFKLLEEFGKNNNSLNIQKLKTNIEKLFAIPQDDDSIVQVMTIHSAKGLEFDTVILPHLERKNASDGNPLLLWMEYLSSNDQTALLLAPIHATGNEKDTIYNYIYRQRQIKANFEIDRLLYVAATRAKKHLHLLFNIQKNAKGMYQVETGSFLKKLWPFFVNDIDSIATSEHLNTNIISLNNEPRHLSCINADWENPIKRFPQIKIATHLKENGFQFTDTNPKLIGMTTHRILQYIGNLGLAWWQNANLDQQLRHLRHHLIQAGTLPENLDANITLTYHIIQNVLNDPRGQWILHPHTDAKSELPLTAIIDGKIENLVIDRTFIDNQDTRWIIDYKTTTLGQKDLEEFLTKEQEKHKNQLHKYAQALQLTDDRPIRLGLYFPAIPTWKEWPTTIECSAKLIKESIF
jgi:ATP-dependent helicase/nuclease subunit A